MAPLKDQRLAELSQQYNVARFVSFDRDAAIRYAVGVDARPQSESADAVAQLFRSDRAGSTVNIRTFLDDESKSTDFVYGLANAADVASAVRNFAAQGLFTIVNETIDVSDGGVSGVSLSGVTEFAPGGTPRIVEDPARQVAQLPTGLAWELLSTVYRLQRPLIPDDRDRIEFSVHPLRVGHRNEHVIVWETGPAHEDNLVAHPRWPNDFSRHIGDKVFGLLVAHLLGLKVPYSTVIPRRVAPFNFGQNTGSGETWIRTAPVLANPGYFTTAPDWLDPFALLAREDPDYLIGSVIAQEGVSPAFAGGALSRLRNSPVIEGVASGGLDFMSGSDVVDKLPARIIRDVEKVVQDAEHALGPVQIEWVHDGTSVWVVQLHTREVGPLSTRQLSSGEADEWLPFDPAEGLDALRSLVRVASGRNAGVEVLKPVGVTSHVGDILRKARVPGRLADVLAP